MEKTEVLIMAGKKKNERRTHRLPEAHTEL